MVALVAVAQAEQALVLLDLFDLVESVPVAAGRCGVVPVAAGRCEAVPLVVVRYEVVQVAVVRCGVVPFVVAPVAFVQAEQVYVLDFALLDLFAQLGCD